MISDYPELISEATHRSQRSDVVNRAAMYVGMAEKMLSKRLRLTDMLTETTLTTDSSGNVDQPADYQEMSTVHVNGCQIYKKPLAKIIDGTEDGYAVLKSTIRSSYKSMDHDAIYYASLPSLEAANTSWLLDLDPELYVQAVLFQIYTGNNDIEKAQATAGYLAGLVEAANDADLAARISGTHVSLGGNTP